MTNKRTTLVRMYIDDKYEIITRFPKMNMADFLHTSVRTNPLIQVEAILRGEKKDVESKKK